ncbi:hypothetical protein [Aquimonas sp.]|jgi:hypothetical protein|uniref:hypothetical protein n=1 Tax=Aquimonas sp. TaxID=1872588 RepID=UPI0037C0755B
MSPWQVLGIEPSEDTRAIKQAYARALKQTRPDADPEGYQRLRECYEWALGWVEWKREHPEQSADAEAYSDADTRVDADEPDADAVALEARPPDSANAVAVDDGEHTPSRRSPVDRADAQVHAARASESHEPRPPDSIAETDHDTDTVSEATPADTVQDTPIAIVDPESLLSSVREYWQRDGDVALVEALPKLLGLLREVPLSLQAEASCRFAAWATQEPLPFEAVAALQEHFDWGRDFRADRVLGDELAAALRKRLVELDLDCARTPRQRAQRTLLKDFQFKLRRGEFWQARWRLLSERGARAAQLVADLTESMWRRPPASYFQQEMKRVAENAELWLAAGFACVLAAIAVLVDARVTVSAAIALAIGLVISAGTCVIFGVLFTKWMDAIARLLQSLAGSGARIGYPRLLAALTICAASAYWGDAVPMPWLLLVASLFAFQLLWLQECRWRMLLLPITAQFAFTLHPMLPADWPTLSSWWIALSWVLVSHFQLSRTGVPPVYREPRVLLPRKAGDVVFYLIGFKAVLAILALGYVVLLPTTSIVQGLREGALRVAGWAGFTILLLVIARSQPLICAAITLMSPLLFFALSRSTQAIAGKLYRPPAAG